MEESPHRRVLSAARRGRVLLDTLPDRIGERPRIVRAAREDVDREPPAVRVAVRCHVALIHEDDGGEAGRRLSLRSKHHELAVHLAHAMIRDRVADGVQKPRAGRRRVDDKVLIRAQGSKQSSRLGEPLFQCLPGELRGHTSKSMTTCIPPAPRNELKPSASLLLRLLHEPAAQGTGWRRVRCRRSACVRCRTTA
eukprot:6323171-Prymnesium_polylepis.1